MGIGAAVRRLAGPLEPALARAYRDFFFDLGDFADRVCALGTPRRVVEVGCGEGAQINELARRLGEATFAGIDITTATGRLFEGDPARATFERLDAAAFAAREPGRADLVLLCDVMHHVPAGIQPGLWQAIDRIAAPDATLVFKEWVRQPTPIYWLGWFSDRFITGDRIRYLRRDEWLAQLARCLPGWEVASEMSLKPWSANHAFVLRRRPGA